MREPNWDDFNNIPFPKPKSGGWIPCKERVPETGAQVLVTIKWAEDDFEVTLGEYWGKAKDETERGWGGEINDKVIAWQPLPEPYREGA